VEKEIQKYRQAWQFQDFKSELQEYTQTKMNCVPAYRVVGEQGPDHEKVFEVEVGFQQQARGTGKGRSKKEAEQAAAREALLTLGLKPGNQS